MHAVGRALFHALRGGAAIIEGAEFLLTHRHIARAQAVHILVAAACTLGATWLAGQLAGYAPAPRAISLPWYLILIEWSWSRLPAVLTVEFAAWAAQTFYLALALPRPLVLAVSAQRGARSLKPLADYRRGPALLWLGVGGVGCAAIACIPVMGPLAAAILACPVLGGGFVVNTLISCGWSSPAALRLAKQRRAMLTGLGLGVVASISVPVVNLMALPCATAGTTCLLLREPDPARTSGGTAPCASPDK